MKEGLELDIKEVFRILVRRAWALLLCAVLVGTAIYVYTATMVPDKYRAKVTMYINNRSDADGSNLTSANLTVAQKLVNTYGTFIQSDLILEKVIENTGVRKTAAQIRRMVKTESVNNTEMFAVYVTGENPQEAAIIANAIADIAPNEISGIIEGSYAKKVDPAKVPTTPISDRRVIKSLSGALIGALCAAIFFVLRTLLDVHVRTEEELEKIGNIPVLGSIPDFEEAAKEPKKKVRK